MIKFQFVNSFISLFYIAFYLQDQERLKVQLAVLLITRQIIQNIKESALPYLIEQFRLAKLSFDIFGALSPSVSKEKRQFTDYFKCKDKKKHAESSTIPQAEVESTLFKYEGTFSEHLEMFIQLGYVVLFSSAFPMAAFCACINNLIEIRSDAFKMCFIYQRPFGERVSNIGMWLNTMEVMGLIAILVNCALIGLSGQVHRMFPDISKTQTILLIVALEHIMLLIRFLISCLIPDKPQWVATEMAKVEFARREAVNRLSSATTTPPSSGTAIIIPNSNNSSCDIQENIFIDDLKIPVETENISRRSSTDSFHVAVESDLSQSIDNIDRLLQNIDEEQETNKSIQRGISRESESSSDFTGTSVSSESGVAKKSFVSKVKDHKSNPVNLVKSAKDWAVSTEDHLNRQPGSSSHTGSWYKNLGARKIASNLEKNYGTHLSTSCIPSAQKESSTESILPQLPLKAKHLPDERVDSAGSETSSATEEILTDPVEKKKKLKSALIKRARSVAVFSLKLKEKRAKAEMKEVEKVKEKVSPRTENIMVGGELSCVPIEMLISIDDVNSKYPPGKKNSSTSSSKAGTPTVPFPNR